LLKIKLIKKNLFSFVIFLNRFLPSRHKPNQQSFAASLIQVGGTSNIVRPIAVDFERHDSQPLYQEPFAALNTIDDNETIFSRQTNAQEDLIVQHQQQQQLLMMQGVSMALDNKGKYSVQCLKQVEKVLNCHF
jgi:hypothetical protein